MLRRDAKIFERYLHGTETGMINVQSIDLVDLDNSQTNSRRFATDLYIQPDARRFVESFRIINAFDFRIRWKNNCGGHHWSGQRTHSNLINTSDMDNAGFPQ